MFPIYKDIRDWLPLESRIIHAYDEDETPIVVIKFQIGELVNYDITNFCNKCSTVISPIIRWVTKNEYTRLKENEGVIIW